MTNRLPRQRLDPFLIAIVGAALVASLLPATGRTVVVFDWVTKALIFVLFFLYGARLHPREALAGLRHWRLHTVILVFTYVVFPLIGLGLRVLVPHVITRDLYLGLLWLCLVPSTVQSSINFTSVAKGNVAGAIVSASLSNIVGVVLTPLLALALMNTGGLQTRPSSMLDIVAQILVPFVVGQLSRRWTMGFVSDHKKPLKLVDQGVIVLVVYTAFSAGMREDIWHRVTVPQLLVVVALELVLLGGLLTLTWWTAGRLGFARADQIAIQFCGTKKSLASGLPMATVLFTGATTPVGLLVLPLMVFHQAQLVACGWLASRYAQRPTH